MLSVKASNYTVRGISVGGVYTSLRVEELGVVLDMGLPLRSFAATDQLFLSHGHVDHVGSLCALLGIRALHGKMKPPTLHLPAETWEPLEAQLREASKLHRFDLAVEAVPMRPGDEAPLRGGRWVRAFRTHHPVPSLGFQFFEKVQKLRPEFRELPGPEIGRRRKAGEPLFDEEERLEVSYATDTLDRVLDTCPSLLQSRVLILECTFLDERKSLEASRRGCHVHLDELLERADTFENEAIVLMHFSQLYSPQDVHRLLRTRCPPHLFERIIPFAPERGPWFG